MESLASLFHIEWKLILAQAINFGIVFFVLYRFLIKPLGKVMKERQQTIESGLAAAKEQERLLGDAKREYDDAKAQAHKEAMHIIQQAKERALIEHAEILAQGEIERKALVDKTTKELKREKEKALGEARRDIGMLVAQATEKLLEEVSDRKVDQKMVDMALKSLEESNERR